MEVSIFIGAHRTASTHLATMITDNSDLLIKQGIGYVPQKLAVKTIGRAQKALSGGTDLQTVQKEMLNTLTQGQKLEKLVIISPNILGVVTRPFGKALFYPRTSALINQLHGVFKNIPIQLFLSVRNPASFIPSCYAESSLSASFSEFDDFITEVNLPDLKWSSLLHRAQGKQAKIPITVWRYEDYPYIWRDVVQAITGVINGQDLVGTTERVSSSITLHGAQLLYRYIENHPPRTRGSFAKTKKVFLEKFPSSPNELVGPNWAPDLVKTLTNNYEDDWYYIERMDAIQTIQPRYFD